MLQGVRVRAKGSRFEDLRLLGSSRLSIYGVKS